MSKLVEVANVVQRPGEPARRWFASESLDVLFWLNAQGQPQGFQLGWQDGGISRTITAQQGQPLRVDTVDEGGKGGSGYAGSALLRSTVQDYDLALVQPRFAAASEAVPTPLRDYVLQALGVPIHTPHSRLQDSLALAGMTVLVTRPLAQAKHLLRLLEDAGAEARLLPLLAIRPPEDAEHAAMRLYEYRRAAAWIFTSANAVSAAAQLFNPKHWYAPKFAVGEATAKALAALGHNATRPPADAIHSEGLLQLPGLRDVAGKPLLIVTGEGGRDGLRAPLEALGAQLDIATVYRREVVPHSAETVEATLQGVDALLLTSGEALVALHRALPVADKARLLSLPLVLPSARVQAMARTLGFSQTLLAATVSDQSFVDALRLWQPQTGTAAA
jgi:uroporphyrinogen-III synthase